MPPDDVLTVLRGKDGGNGVLHYACVARADANAAWLGRVLSDPMVGPLCYAPNTRGNTPLHVLMAAGVEGARAALDRNTLRHVDPTPEPAMERSTTGRRM